MAMTSGPYIPIFEDPVAFLFTDGGHITYPYRSDTKALCSVVTTARSPNWMGTLAVTSDTGELSAIYHALEWVQTRRTSPLRGLPQIQNLIW